MADGRVDFALSPIGDFTAISDTHPNLTFTKSKGRWKFKWLGSFDELKCFVSAKLYLTGLWSFKSNSGGFHVLKSSTTSISFYPGTKTLCIQGTAQTRMVEKLLSLGTIEPSSTNQPKDPKSKSNDDSDAISEISSSSHEINACTHEISSEDVNDDLFESTLSNDLCLCSNVIETSVREIRKEFQLQIDELKHEISQISAPKPSQINKLQAENIDLKEKLIELQLRLENSTKENERVVEENKSLLVVIGLIHKENGKDYETKNHNIKENLHQDKRPLVTIDLNEVESYSQLESLSRPLTRPLSSNKRTNEDVPRVTRKQRPSQPSTRIVQQRNINQKEVFIVGDSIVKNLQGHRISKDPKVKVWSFPGCTSKDMKDHIQPLLRRNPQEIILHVGTNSIRSSESAQACADEIADLAALVNSNSTKVTISSLLPRSDDEDLGDIIKEVNEIIGKLCQQNKWSFIDHQNINTNTHLNRSGLHLNKIGNTQFAKDFIDYIKSN